MFATREDNTGYLTVVVEETVFFPGMVNLSGTLCYMNSVLQVRIPVHS